MRIVDLSSDLAPVICVLISSNDGENRRSMGASSQDDVELCCWKALCEASLTIVMPRRKLRRPDEILRTLNGPGDHAELYATGEYDHLLDAFFGSTELHDLSDLAHFSGNILQRLQHAGSDVYVANIADPRTRKIAPSIHVIRAIIPDLVPIQFGPGWPRTGSPRIKTVPELMKWKPKAIDERDYQLFPHPFP